MKKRLFSLALVLVLLVGMFPGVTASAASAPSGYTTDANGIMAYAYMDNSFDLKGYFAENWRSTTYSDDGYITYIKVAGGDPTLVNPKPYADGGTAVNGLAVGIDFDFLNDGKTLQIVYSIKNNGGESVTFSIGTGADIQIGRDDSALITPFEDGSGYKMVSDDSNDKGPAGDYAQFNFFGKGYGGVTPVSDYWYGPYSSSYGSYYWSDNSKSAVFYGASQCNSGSFDSAGSWHWSDKVVDGGEVVYFSVLIGIGGAGSENAANGGTVSEATGSVTLDLTVPATEIEVWVDGTELEAGTHYTVSGAEGNNPVITFLPAAGLTPSSEIVAKVKLTGEQELREIKINNNIKIESYTVSFNANGGEESPASQTATYGQAIGQLPVPTRSGYTFGGWYYDDTPITAETVYNYTTSIELKAKWTANEYTVSFNADGGEVSPASKTATYGQAIGELPVPTLTGYTFGGWYYGDNLITAETVYNYTTNIELTAQWEINTYTVSFDSQGGSEVAPQTVEHGGVATMPEDPIRTGYVFGYWMLDGEEYDFSTPVTGEIELTAKWYRIIVVTPVLPKPDEPEKDPTEDHPCPICGGCVEADCDKCEDKCLLLTMNFTDVEDGKWYTESIEYVYHHQLMIGISDNLFDTFGAVNRAMVVTMLYRLEGSPEFEGSSSFTDLDADWYTAAVNWAYLNGIANGISETEFAPEQDVTRQQFVAFLYRYARFKGMDLSSGEGVDLSDFADCESVSDYAVPAVKWAIAEGIIFGTDKGLEPVSGANRAQAAAMLYRFLGK